jgi:hypothetical protein
MTTTPTTTNTTQYRGYTVVSSLDGDHIFLKVTEPDSFTSYEARIDSKELRLQNNAAAIYKVITETFADNNTNRALAIDVADGLMTLTFHALVGYFLDVHIHFDIVLCKI